jgi:hypothetical protein
VIDLVCLVADKNMEAVVDAILQRPQSLGIRPITTQIDVHPHRDSGCYHNATPFLRPYLRHAHHACVVMDRSWEGAPAKPTVALEADVDRHLEQLGAGWAKSIVIDPELEAWLVRRSPRLDDKLGWRGRSPTLAAALAENGMWPAAAAKPADPKATIEWALQQARVVRSSSIYRDLAGVLGTKDCTDASFGRFRAMLQAWFPEP